MYIPENNHNLILFGLSSIRAEMDMQFCRSFLFREAFSGIVLDKPVVRFGTYMLMMWCDVYAS